MKSSAIPFVMFVTAITALSLPLAGPAQAFGGAPMVPQAIERHLEQERLQQQIEQREAATASPKAVPAASAPAGTDLPATPAKKPAVRKARRPEKAA